MERLGEHLHLKEAEKEFTIAFYSHAGCKKRKQMSKQDKHTKNHGNWQQYGGYYRVGVKYMVTEWNLTLGVGHMMQLTDEVS